MSRFQPLTPERLADALVDRITGLALEHPARVAFDGPRAAQLVELAAAVRDRLERLGLPAVTLQASAFYRDASVRLEHGRTDVESFYSGWLDIGAIQREVLSPLGGPGPWHYLPALRNPVTNRSARQSPVAALRRTVLLLVGELLLGVGLEFDLTVHASMARAAQHRRTEPDWAWTLPAFDRYDIDVDPSSTADVVIRYDDPARPALRVR